MFTHLLPPNNDSLFAVEFSSYAKRHYLKRFEKDYKGKRWEVTLESIVQDLARIKTSASDLQRTQQVDELWHKGDVWVFKYDFRIAQSKESAKASGNRCVVFLDDSASQIEILMIFGKTDLPKNKGEQAFIEQVISEEFGDHLAKTK